jgi:hypothetical protein
MGSQQVIGFFHGIFLPQIQCLVVPVLQIATQIYPPIAVSKEVSYKISSWIQFQNFVFKQEMINIYEHLKKIKRRNLELYLNCKK